MNKENNGRVMPLVTPDPQGKLRVVRETVEHIKGVKSSFGFVCICGDYRSGKSFLLNSLFLEFRGFQTSGTTQACTKGINIWSQPLIKNGVAVWILDTEGFGSIQKDSQYDGKIFLLSLLLSNMLLYNSFGAIDENNIQKLAMICRQATSMDEKWSDAHLFWILRDFSLEMVDKTGHNMTGDEYLQQCLRQGENGHNKTEKDLLKKLFSDRHCFPLIRPVIDEQKLNNLNGINIDQLREQFKQEIVNLSKKIDECMGVKIIKGMELSQKNIQIVVQQFIEVLNSQNIDCALNCSYDKIKEYQQGLMKDKIIYVLRSKIQNLNKLLPVKYEYINYLQNELNQIVLEQIQEKKDQLSKQNCEGLRVELQLWICKQKQKLEKTNRQMIEQQQKQFLYRKVIELYPTLIGIQLNQFEVKFYQNIKELKKEYQLKYVQYCQSEIELQKCWCLFMEKQIQKLFSQLVKRWKNNNKELQQNLEETKRAKERVDKDLQTIKEEKRKTTQNLQDFRRQEGRSMSKLKLQIQQTYKQQLTIVATDYEQKLKQITQVKDIQIRQLKSKLDAQQQQKIEISRSMQYQKQSLLEKIALEHEKMELVNIKFQQFKNSSELQSQQLKTTYENKIKIIQIKLNQTSNNLNNQRKKFQVISEERRKEQTEIMEQLQFKNDKIDQLSQQLLQLQQKYRAEMERILNEEKQILVKTISNKMDQYEYKCKIYQGQLQQCNTTIRQLQSYQQKSDELEVQVRQLKGKLEESCDEITMLRSKMGKMEGELSEKQRMLATLRQNYQKELNLANQKLFNNGKFIKQAQERHQQEINYFHRKIETELNEQSQIISRKHQQNLRQNKILQEQKFSKERAQLKEMIANNYEQIQRNKMTVTQLNGQIQKIHGILLKIRNSHQNIGQSPRGSASPIKQHLFSPSDDLVKISQSPEQYSQILQSSKKSQKIQFLAEQIQQIYNSMHKQIQLLDIERVELKEKLEAYIEELSEYDRMVSRTQGENRSYRSEVQELKRQSMRMSSFEGLQEYVEKMEKENYHLSKDIQLKDQANSKRDQQLQENIKMYKSTISALTSQNKNLSGDIRKLTSQNAELEEELERFRLLLEVRDKDNWITRREDEKMDESTNRIKDLQAELKKMISKVQKSRLEQVEKQSQKENVLGEVRKIHHQDEMSRLRKQNQLLYQQLKQSHEKQLHFIETSKVGKTRHNEEQSNRYHTLEKQYQNYKKSSKQTIKSLKAELDIYGSQKKQLEKQFKDFQQNLNRKYELSHKMMEQQLKSLKQQKQTSHDLYTRKIAILQQSLSSKVNQTDRKLAQTQLKYQTQREQLQKSQRKLELQSQRHRLKYEHILKVNNQLIKQIQQQKSKAHQLTLKQKYKQKISKLFTD